MDAAGGLIRNTVTPCELRSVPCAQPLVWLRRSWEDLQRLREVSPACGFPVEDLVASGFAGGNRQCDLTWSRLQVVG
jgi:hypothetical protein